MSPITIYTDGSALGNPGPGGYGAVLLSGHHRKELSQGFRLTTNNRMELMAVCVALETLKFEGSDVVIYSDSKYVVDAVSKGWVFGWVRKGFAGKKNPDLWMRFLRVQPPQRPFRLGQGPRRNSREQPLRLFGRGGGQRQGALARRHGLRSRRAVKRKAAAPFFRHKVHHNPSNYRTFFAFRVIIPIFTPRIA